MYRILVLGFEKFEFNKFEQFSSGKDFRFIYASHILEAIGHLETGHIQLVIYQNKSAVSDLFEIYNILESFLQKHKVPVFLVVDRNEIDLIKKALEMGIDNLVFKPFNFPNIEKKINSQIFKRKFASFIENESFLQFFDHNTIPLILLENNRVTAVNQVFLNLISAYNLEYKGVKLAELFQFENDPAKYYQFKRLQSGLIQSCIIEKVIIKGMEKNIFDLFLVRDSSGIVLTQLNILNNNESSNGKYSTNGSDSENGSRSSKKLIDHNLTKRELEVLKLSSDGLPIKIIAQELNLSSRTVEKHRANIMEKFGAKNIIEVIRQL
jgi:DNA-binding NarL/FixJ family response regulator